jgi:hypothetical protein
MKSNFLKIGIFAAAFSLLYLGANAQAPTVNVGPLNQATSQQETLENLYAVDPADLPYEDFEDNGETFDSSKNEDVDYVTAGSRMPYRVKVDPPQGMASIPISWVLQYKWLFDPSLAILPISGGSTALTPTTVHSAPAHFYAENEISIVIPNSPGTTIQITTDLRTVVNGTALNCGTTPTEITNDIVIVPPPSVEWDASLTIAGTDPDFKCDFIPIPVKITGYSEFEIEFKISFDDGDQVSNTETRFITVTVGDVVGGGDTDVSIPMGIFAEAAGSVGAFGTYEIEIVNITDRISRKSLDAVAGVVPNDPYIVQIIPAPKPTLQHIRNVGL